MNKNEFTLTEISKFLQIPQHRLIYFCESKVIVPDKSDAKGRGSSRRFSERNLFEFCVSITLSEFHVPAHISAKLILVLRLFANEVEKLVPNFQFPSSLASSNSPQINLLLTNGAKLFFILDMANTRPIVLGGVDLNKNSQTMHIANIEVAFEGNDDSFDMNGLIHQISGSCAYFILNLTQMAWELKTKLDTDI